MSTRPDDPAPLPAGVRFPGAGGEGAEPVPTDPARKFELMFRLYAPTKVLFEKEWVLPEIEKVQP